MSSADDITHTERFRDFLSLSKVIGSDVLKTQGAGGNTSIKEAGAMWVKASGTWLAHARERDIMVPVLVEPLVQALRNGDPKAEKSTDFVIEALNTSGLRPSIETSFHAALVNPLVAHYHCVNTIALAVLEERDELIAERLNKLPDLRWATIPYRRPGTPLAREIERVAHTRPDVLVLFNHGVVIVGETVEEVSERVDRVTEALTMPPRTVPMVDQTALSLLAEGSDYRPAVDLESHKTALCPTSMAFAVGGSMYPDHVIFLGTELGVLSAGQSALELAKDYHARGLEAPKLILAPGNGVLLSRSLTPGGEAMVRCLAEVVTRIPADAEVVYLTKAEEHELTHWEAEQYRQMLDRRALGTGA
jgi:rhamnose utilization protein RhaD (predicted bifunctional aldolase and dehydrogenase)